MVFKRDLTRTIIPPIALALTREFTHRYSTERGKDLPTAMATLPAQSVSPEDLDGKWYGTILSGLRGSALDEDILLCFRLSPPS